MCSPFCGPMLHSGRRALPRCGARSAHPTSRASSGDRQTDAAVPVELETDRASGSTRHDGGCERPPRSPRDAAEDLLGLQVVVDHGSDHVHERLRRTPAESVPDLRRVAPEFERVRGPEVPRVGAQSFHAVGQRGPAERRDGEVSDAVRLAGRHHVVIGHVGLPDQPERVPYLFEALKGSNGPIIAASDYVKALPDQLAPWLRDRLVSLGTDGFGRSDNRKHLRRFFENDAESIAAAALSKLVRDGKFDGKKARKAMQELGLDPEQKYSAIS